MPEGLTNCTLRFLILLAILIAIQPIRESGSSSLKLQGIVVMRSGIHFTAVTFFALVLSACGGSSNDSEPPKEKEPEETPSPSPTEELKERYRGYVDERFTGKTTQASLSENPDSIRQFNAMLVGSKRMFWPQAPGSFYQNTVDSDINLPADIDETIECFGGGSYHLSGTLNADKTGTFELDYNDCFFNYGAVLNGSAIVSLTYPDDKSALLFFDNLSAQFYTRPEERLTGFAAYSASGDTPQFDYELYLLSTNTETQQQRVEKSVRQIDGGSMIANGTLLISNYGRVDLSTDERLDFPRNPSAGALRFEGGNNETAFIEYVDRDFTRLLLDQNGDTVPDVGYYFSSADHLLSADFSEIELMPVDMLGFPPDVEPLRLMTQAPDTTGAISVEPATYSDRDTESEKLTVTYEWRINGEPHPGANGTTLPAGTAKKDDRVEVRALVSDGQFTAGSGWLEFIIADAPGEVSIGDIPDRIRVGENLILPATYTDPDNTDSRPANLVYGPPGMHINSDGAIEWTADQTLFDTSTVHFGFDFPDNSTGELHEFSIIVEASDVSIPRARAGITLPANDQATFIANFTNDGGNEIITMDANRVYAFRENEGQYRETWVYPYAMPAGGRIRSIAVFDTDNDGKQEILVASGGGLNRISGPNDPAIPLWETDDSVELMTVSDMDHDGRAEVVIISSQTSGYYGYQTLTVLELGDTVETVFETAMNVSASAAVIGNVDEDPGLELVMNNGLVYDGTTWANEWYRGTPFSNGQLLVGDLDGDGINEIIAADSRGSELRVFSATEKSLIHSTEIAYACSMQSANFDQDESDELVIGVCSYGNIIAYDWSDGSLQQLWELPSGGYNPAGVTVGDIDNDGEPEVFWGTGSSSNYRDILMVADLTDPEPTIVFGKNDNLPLGTLITAAGWGDVEPGEEYAIFNLPRTGPDNREHRLAYMAEDAQFIVSPPLTTDWSNESYAEVVDYNLDGYADIFVSTRNAFRALALNDLSVHWALETSSNRIDQIGAIKLNDDDYTDAVYVKGSSISAVDIYNETLLHTITTEDDIEEFVYLRPPSGEVYLAVSLEYTSGLVIWHKQGNRFEPHSQYNLDCQHLLSAQVDTDAKPELVCAKRRVSSGKTEFVVFDLEGDTLQESHRFKIEGRITDLVVDNSRSESQMLIAATAATTSYYNEPQSAYIRGISPQAGKEIWSSPPLIGKVVAESLYYRPNVGGGRDRLMFATEHAMYLVK